MKEICQLLSDQHFSFEYFLKIEFVRKISLKEMIFRHYMHEWVSVLLVLLIGVKFIHMLPGLFCLKAVGYLLAHSLMLLGLNSTRLVHLGSRQVVSHNVLLSDGIIKEIFVFLVFVLEIYRQIYQAVLGTACMNGLNDNSFIGNPLHTTLQFLNFPKEPVCSFSG